MNAHALSGFSVKVDTVETRLIVFSRKTWFRLSIHVVCHMNPWSDKVCMCSAMRVTRIVGFFFEEGRLQFTSFDAILWAPFLLQEFFLFSVRQCNKLYRKLMYVFFRESFRWETNWGDRKLLVLRIEAIRSSLTCGHEDDLGRGGTLRTYPSVCYFNNRISTSDHKRVSCVACLRP
jgi:hypothetical protein